MSATTSSEPISATFAALREARRSALVIYVTAGHPDPERSLALLKSIEEAGADIIELGIPFSDPMADGPAIQESSRRALEAGMTFDGALDLLQRAKLRAPVVLFSYLNPVLSAGADALDRAAAAGASGILVTDLPVGADPDLEARIAGGPLAFVRLVAPTTPVQRMEAIGRHGSGFVYLISRLGVTGARDELPTDLSATLESLRSVCQLPICVGFGISRPEQAAAVARIADGVVVGSAVVREAGESVERAARLVRGLRAAVDSVAH